MKRERFEEILPKLQGKIRAYDKGEVVIIEESRQTEIGVLVSGELCKAQFYGDGTGRHINNQKES